MSESLRILILEDNPIDAELVQFELKEAGIIFAAKVVMNEEEYLREIQKYCPDLILSDYDLPKYNGALALAEARRRCPDTPFILVTGAVSEDRAIEILTQGAKDYVLKNRIQQRLAPAVRRALAEATECRARKQAEDELKEAHKTLEEKVRIRTADLEFEMAIRKKTEEALLQREEQLKNLYHESPIPTLTWQKKGDDFILVDFNRAAIQLTEDKVSKYLGKSAAELYEDRPQILSDLNRCYSERISVRQEVISQHFAPNRLLSVQYGFIPPDLIIVHMDDQTERKHGEEALRKTLERAAWLARFPEENPNPVVRASAEGIAMYCNPASIRDLAWACNLGDPLPDPVRMLATQAIVSRKELHREVQLGALVYAVTLVPFPEESYINIYGREITKRKQAEELLRRSEESLKRSQEIAHLGSWELDLTTKQLLIWSDETYRIFGLEPQEFTATYEAFLECVHPDDRQAVDAAYSGSIGENLDTYEIEHRIIRRNTGEIRFVRERCHHYRDKSNRIIRSMGMVQDITDLYRAEEALRESEARVRLKLQSILSPEGDIGDLELADIIDVAAIRSLMTDFYDLVRIPMSIIDLKGRVIVGVGWQEICTKFHRIHPETGRYCLESDTELSSGISPGESKLYKCKNNMWDIATPIFVGGKHVGNVFSGQFSFEDERIDYNLFRSQAACFGFDEADYLAALEKVPRLGREEIKTGMDFFMKFAALISQLSYANIKLARSVSEHDTLMASLSATNEALETRSEQLAATNRELESFSYSVSHDLRAPLRAIDGYSRMILRKHADKFDEDARGKFNLIMDNTRMMSQLIDDLLAFSHLGKTQLSVAKLDMSVMIREVWEEISATNPERNLKLTIGATPPAAADRGLIRQVLVNLLSNAVKFTRQRPEALIEVGGHLKDAECIYTVRDNGAGFDMQYHDKMFGVFQRLHSAKEFEGTGVGLAIVQRIIYRHAGRVWAEGEVDKGATFYFTLPVRPD